MNSRNLILLTALIVISISSCKKTIDPYFSLYGFTNSIKDSTTIYLVDTFNDSLIDSTLIFKNEFKFSTNLPYTPLLGRIEISSTASSKVIWLTNDKIELHNKEGNFENSTLLNSPLTDRHEEIYLQFDTLPREKGKDFLQNFIKNHPNNILSAYTLRNWYNSWKKATTTKLYNGLSEEVKNSVFGHDIKKYISLAKEPKIGNQYINLELPDPVGQPTILSENLSKLTLIDFWSSGCKPCRKDNKELRKLYTNYKQKGFNIYQISLDENEKHWTEAIEKDSLNWINVSDLKGWRSEAALIYGVSFMPSNYLINSNGSIIASDIKPKDLAIVLQKEL